MLEILELVFGCLTPLPRPQLSPPLPACPHWLHSSQCSVSTSPKACVPSCCLPVCLPASSDCRMSRAVGECDVWVICERLCLICLFCFGNRVSHSLGSPWFPWFHCGAKMGPERLLCCLVSQLCLVGNRMLGDAPRIPGAAVSHLLPLCTTLWS